MDLVYLPSTAKQKVLAQPSPAQPTHFWLSHTELLPCSQHKPTHLHQLQLHYSPAVRRKQVEGCKKEEEDVKRCI